MWQFNNGRACSTNERLQKRACDMYQLVVTMVCTEDVCLFILTMQVLAQQPTPNATTLQRPALMVDPATPTPRVRSLHACTGGDRCDKAES